MLLDFPRIAIRNCAFCEQHDHDDGPGGDNLVVLDSATNEPLTREPPHPQAAPLGWAPCRLKQAGKTTTGCPKGTPEESNALSDRNYQAYQHFKECQATGRFPDDPIVAANAAIISRIETEWAHDQQQRSLELLVLKARAAALGADG